MPCYEKVTVSVDLVIKDVESFKKAVKELGGRFTSETTFTLHDIEYSGVVKGGTLNARADRGVNVDTTTDLLRKKYVVTATTAWAKKHKFNVKINADETKIQMRKWS